MEKLYLYMLLFSACLFWFLIRPLLQQRFNTKDKKQPPGPTGLPILGALHRLGPQVHLSLYDLAQIHGPLMTLRLGFITTVVASSPETAKEVLQKHDQNFSNRTIPDVVTAQPNHQWTLAWVPGDHQWRNRRRICNTQMFNTQKLDSLQHLRHEKVNQLIAHVRKLGVSGSSVVDVGQVAFATTLNLISNTIFSIDLVDPDFESAQEFKDLVWRIMEDAGKPNISDYFPVLKRFDFQGVKKHIRPSYMRLHEIFDEVIDERLKSRASNTADRKDDFLDVLLDQPQENGSDFSREAMKPLILDLFIAGSDTSAITIEWAMAELLHKPQVLQKARKELIETIGTERLMKESDIERLPYLEAVVKETLRLHPAAPLLLPYKAQNDVDVCGFTIPKDSQVIVNAWAIGRDPTYWKDPLSFSPERFLSSDVDFRGRDFEYIPFGAGRRICPGLPLALRMVHLVLGSLIQAFNWELPPGTTPDNIDMRDQFGVTLKKAVPLKTIPIVDG